MDGRITAGIAAGAAGLGAAIGLHVVARSTLDARDATVEREWNEWRGELDRAFPRAGSGDVRRPLHGDADEQRFERFLADTPAPTWVRIEHADLRAISIDPSEPRATGQNWTGLAALGAGIGGGLAMGITGAVLSSRAGQGGSTLGLALNIAGATLGLASIAGTFALPKGDLMERIESSEWRVPSKWHH